MVFNFKDYLLLESGVRNINNIVEKYKKADIYFHIDLDGVTSAIGMKEYLKSYGLTDIVFHTIQYGSKTYDLLKPRKDSLPILVDFSHGKIEFKIHTDHHEEQIGVETKSTFFKKSPSNAETISSYLSSKEIFPIEDIEIISMVDSAKFKKYDIKPEDVINFVFSFDKDKKYKNKQKLGLVVNKMILTYKNKKNFLIELVKLSSPSLIDIFLNIKRLIEKMNLTPIDQLISNSNDYLNRLKDYPKMIVKNGILIQFGTPEMYKSGAYDRYSSFFVNMKDNKDIDFFIMVWDMGLVQVSMNPFSDNKEKYQDVNLGEIANKILDEYKEKFENIKITLNNIKKFMEEDISKSYYKGYDNNFSNKFGFRYSDLKNFYKDKVIGLNDDNKDQLKNILNKKYLELNENEKDFLNNFKISLWNIIKTESGGHKKITNIQGFRYLNDGKKVPYKKEMVTKSEYYSRIIAVEIYNYLSKIEKSE